MCLIIDQRAQPVPCCQPVTPSAGPGKLRIREKENNWPDPQEIDTGSEAYLNYSNIGKSMEYSLRLLLHRLQAHEQGSRMRRGHGQGLWFSFPEASRGRRQPKTRVVLPLTIGQNVSDTISISTWSVTGHQSGLEQEMGSPQMHRG